MNFTNDSKMFYIQFLISYLIYFNWFGFSLVMIHIDDDISCYTDLRILLIHYGYYSFDLSKTSHYWYFFVDQVASDN